MAPKSWPEVPPNALDEHIPWGEPLVVEHTSAARTMMRAAWLVATAEGDDKRPYEERFERLERLRDTIGDVVTNLPTDPDHHSFFIALVQRLASVAILHNQIERLVVLKHGDQLEELMGDS